MIQFRVIILCIMLSIESPPIGAKIVKFPNHKKVNGKPCQASVLDCF